MTVCLLTVCLFTGQPTEQPLIFENMSQTEYDEKEMFENDDSNQKYLESEITIKEEWNINFDFEETLFSTPVHEVMGSNPSEEHTGHNDVTAMRKIDLNESIAPILEDNKNEVNSFQDRENCINLNKLNKSE